LELQGALDFYSNRVGLCGDDVLRVCLQDWNTLANIDRKSGIAIGIWIVLPINGYYYFPKFFAFNEVQRISTLNSLANVLISLA